VAGAATVSYAVVTGAAYIAGAAYAVVTGAAIAIMGMSGGTKTSGSGSAATATGSAGGTGWYAFTLRLDFFLEPQRK